MTTLRESIMRLLNKQKIPSNTKIPIIIHPSLVTQYAKLFNLTIDDAERIQRGEVVHHNRFGFTYCVCVSLPVKVTSK